MTLAKAIAWDIKAFIVQASLVIITYNRQNIFIVHATGDKVVTVWLKVDNLFQQS